MSDSDNATIEMWKLVGNPWSYDHGWGTRTADERWATVEQLKAERTARTGRQP